MLWVNRSILKEKLELTNVTILVADYIESTKLIVGLDLMERIPEFKRTLDELSKKVSMPLPDLSEPEVEI